MEDMKSQLIDYIIKNFSSLNDMVAEITSIVTQTPQGFSASIYNTMEVIAKAMIPTAIIIAVLFFIIELCNKTIMMEIVSWENVAKLMLKLILAKVMIQSSFWLLEAIFSATVDLMSVVGSATLTIPVFDESIIRNEIEGMGVFAVLGFLATTGPLNIILTVITWVVKIIIYGRMIELYILFAVSPLPIATLAGEGVHDVAKKFFQNFIAVSLQGIIILIAIGVFGGFIGEVVDLAGGSTLELLNGYILMTLILALTLFKSGSWAKQIVGLM